MNLGTAITLARENLKWSKKELAAKAELSPSAITRIENGDQGIPLRTAQTIATALGLKMWQLVIVAESIDEPSNEIKTLQQKLVLASQPYFALVQKDLLQAMKKSATTKTSTRKPKSSSPARKTIPKPAPKDKARSVPVAH